MPDKVKSYPLYPLFIFEETNTENYFLSSDYNAVKEFADQKNDNTFYVDQKINIYGKKAVVEHVIIYLHDHIDDHSKGNAPTYIGNDNPPSNLTIKIYYRYL